MDILDYIPYGTTDKPMKRSDIVRLTGLSDRKVRRYMQEAKLYYPIVNIGDGYYIPDDPDDPNLKAYIIQETHRIREISRGLRRHKRLFKTNKNQETLDI